MSNLDIFKKIIAYLYLFILLISIHKKFGHFMDLFDLKK